MRLTAYVVVLLYLGGFMLMNLLYQLRYSPVVARNALKRVRVLSQRSHVPR